MLTALSYIYNVTFIRLVPLHHKARCLHLRGLYSNITLHLFFVVKNANL